MPEVPPGQADGAGIPPTHVVRGKCGDERLKRPCSCDLADRPHHDGEAELPRTIAQTGRRELATISPMPMGRVSLRGYRSSRVRLNGCPITMTTPLIAMTSP
jgi:hypothetical protein